MKEVTVEPTDLSNTADDGYAFELSGGHLALDFTNTISRRKESADSTEYLPRYGRLVSWGVQAGLVTAKAAERLRVEARNRPRAAVTALRRAVAIREAAFALFVAIARGEKPPAAALEAINAALPEALA